MMEEASPLRGDGLAPPYLQYLSDFLPISLADRILLGDIYRLPTAYLLVPFQYPALFLALLASVRAFPLRLPQ